MSSGVAPSNIRVVVRVRPLNERDKTLNPSDKGVLQIKKNEGIAAPLNFGTDDDSAGRGGSGASEGTIGISEQTYQAVLSHVGPAPRRRATAAVAQSRSFVYDSLFGPQSTQEEIFDSVKGITEAVCGGYNGTILAYGQTGSGKTHTILYSSITTNASFFEIYNDRVFDLISKDDCVDKELAVREKKAGVWFVKGLTEVPVQNITEALNVLRKGTRNRIKKYETADGSSKVQTSKYTLVDLAGSERQESTGATGDRLKEASMINNSLLTLGQVVSSLVAKQGVIPYRDSNLTKILRDSLGGNSKCCLVATVSPSVCYVAETTSTLEFAQKAKLVKNITIQNEDTFASNAALKAENARLRSALKARNSIATSSTAFPSPNAPNRLLGFKTPMRVAMASLQNNNMSIDKALLMKSTKKKTKIQRFDNPLSANKRQRMDTHYHDASSLALCKTCAKIASSSCLVEGTNSLREEVGRLMSENAQLEKVCSGLQSEIAEKDDENKALMEKLKTAEVHKSELEGSIEFAQIELNVAKQKSAELQLSLDSVKADAVEAINKAEVVENELIKMTDRNKEKTEVLEKHLAIVRGDNTVLTERLQNAANHIEILQRKKKGAYQQLELAQQRTNANLESYK
ncbi:hypothetical protein ACHAWF_007291 [Thalassiosira exigua]